MGISREDIGKIAQASAEEIAKRLETSSNPSARGVDIRKLPGYVYFWRSDRPFSIVWERHKDGTVSFTSLRLSELELVEFAKE